jgi:hypothetical protein
MSGSVQVYGSGKYRFNQYGSGGYLFRQFRFKTKDAAIHALCGMRNHVYWVKEGEPDYEVNEGGE